MVDTLTILTDDDTLTIDTVDDELLISFFDTGVKGDPGLGLPAGGNPLQVLVKNSTTDYDTSWQTFTAAVADGDKGDIAVSSAGNVWTIDTFNSNVGVFGSASKTVTVTFNAKGLATTAAHQDIAIGSTQVTDFVEAVQDIMGGILVSAGDVTWTYNDASNSLTAVISNSAVTYAKIQNVSATARVLGRKTPGAGVVEELAASDINTIINSTVAPAFANISSKPTTLSGYGITDGQPLDSDLTALAANTTAGLWASTTVGAGAARSLAQPAAGLTIANPAGTAGNPTFALANDLAALEALASTGIAVRTASDTWAQRTITGSTNISIANGDGVSGNPTVSLQTSLALTGYTLNMGSSGVITNLPDPTNAQDAATKAYVDAAIQGLDPKPSAKCATTANITLSAEQTIDGVTTSASIVLVKNQTTASQNGLYLSGSGAWTRILQMDAWTEVPGAYTWVEQGTINGDTAWICTADQGGTINTTSITWSQFGGVGTYTAGSGLSLTGTQFSIATNGVSNAMFRQSAAFSVVGVSGNAMANVADISASAADQVLRMNGVGTAIGWGAIDLSKTAAVTGVLQAASHPALAGDVTSTAGSLTTTIANSAVTYAKMQNVSATSKFLGRKTAGAGVVEELNNTDAKTILDVRSTDIADFTEATQDVIGALFVTGGEFTYTYNDAGNAFSVALTAASIANSKLSTMANLTIQSNVSGGVASPSNNTLGAILDAVFGSTQGKIVVRQGAGWAALGPGTTGQVPTSQGSGADWIMSTPAGGGGSPGGSNTQVQYNNAGVFAGFTFGGDMTLNVGTGVATIANDAVTYAKMQNVSATSRIMGRKTASAGDMEELTGADASTILNAAITNTYISGLNLSYATTTTFTVAVGGAKNEDSGTKYDMVLSSAMTKSLSAWAAGTTNGGLDTGSVAASTWYHVHLIRKDSDGSIDVLYSLSVAAPTMPAGYTARRRIGSIKTNGSSQIVQFTQFGNEFLWDAAVIDFDVTNPGTTAVSRTLSVPTGVKVLALINGGAYCGTNNGIGIIYSSLDVSDQAPQTLTTAALTGANTNGSGVGVSAWNLIAMQVRTNTSAQIRTRASVSGASDRIGGITRGWIDLRGAL